MSNHSDFSSHGYQIIRELGRNREAGRITYLAKRSPLAPLDKGGTGGVLDRGGTGGGVLDRGGTGGGVLDRGGTTGGVLVVIKEFRFAMGGADWSGFKAYQREIELLQQLNHPRIPRYLDSFETSSGFCLVQEYKNAPSLAERRSFTPEEIKQIAVSVLEILVDLQKRTPPVIHRDIKPENILVDKQLNAYLIDFGFARIRGGEMALSSVAAGTVGFMPPEEQFGRSLTEASDLYSLGATLICLLTGIRSVDVGKLIDDNYRFEFKKLVPKINPRFVEWLTKMVEPNLKNRYANAAVALAALKPIDVVGSASWRETLGRTMKPRIAVPVVGLATLGVFAVIGTNLIVFGIAERIAITQQVAAGKDAIKQLRQTNKCERCNLQYAYLEGANLRGADLGSANLGGANLQRANLGRANLGRANLGRANLLGANLQRANLVSANLVSANLPDANLWGANLQTANLQTANLQTANLRRANLERANLGRANLLGANLERANLGRANLGRANLLGANLQRANLVSANLVSANLPDANLWGANLQTANLQTANLQTANLQTANLRRANLERANLGRANLGSANLGRANLVSAELLSAELLSADLGGAELVSADLGGANLRDANLRDAILQGAIMPDGTTHP